MTDLTRWNRAGLSRFRYVDGNAVLYLESLRQALVEAFTGPDGTVQWEALESAIPVGVDEDPAERQDRWRRQYYDERRDYGWEILRALARSVHVLGEHVDEYANESFIGTASQWDNVRRLVEMLDYHPGPPASAQTTVALLAKGGKAGTVEMGFAIKNQPDDGSAPAVFETLDDVDVDAGLNLLRPLDHDLSQELFEYVLDSGGEYVADFPLADAVADVSAGATGVLLIDRAAVTPVAIAVTVAQVTSDGLVLSGAAPPASMPATVRRHAVRLRLAPDLKAVPRLSGDNVVTLGSGHGLTVNDRVAWGPSIWTAAFVEDVQGPLVRLSPAPPQGAEVFRVLEAAAQDLPAGRRVVLPPDRKTATVWDDSLSRISAFDVERESDGASGVLLYNYVDPAATGHDRAFFVPEGPSVSTVQGSNPQKLELDGDGGGLGTGDPVLVVVDGALDAAFVEAVDGGTDTTEIHLGETFAGTLSALFGKFAVEVRPSEWNLNRTPAYDTGSISPTASVLVLDPGDWPELLDVGRSLIVSGPVEAVEVMVADADPVAGTLVVEPALPGSDSMPPTDKWPRFATVVYGNVVAAGHGETQPERTLGSGDATVAGQTLHFDVEGVSFVADATQPTGVRAALVVSVAGRIWLSVATLNDSEPEDPHYEVQLLEDGTLELRFGDGRRGRRLPTGGNNVRVAHRIGTGSAGNVVPGSLVKDVRPHHLVDGIIQPLDATGGNDMEGVEAMRVNAPASSLTLARAVSLRDFGHLAEQNSRVWQARAFLRPSGVARSEQIDVAVVPAGGGALGTLGNELEDFLGRHALPGARVTVVPFESVLLDLELTLRIKTTEYDPLEVALAVEHAVVFAFALERSRLGAPVFRSRVFEVVESVPGVENCDCDLNGAGFRNVAGDPVVPRSVGTGPDGDIRRISAEDHQVIHFDAAGSSLLISTTEFTV